MGDTTPATFDPKPKFMPHTYTFVAGATILAGQVVGIHGTGVDFTVHPTADGSIDNCVGVAMHDAASGAYVTVALPPAIIKVCEGAGAAIDAGDNVMLDSVAGCVITASDAADDTWVGYALEDITANSTGYIMLFPQYVPKGA